MLGAIIGDIVGSRFEFNNTNNPHFGPLFAGDCSFTDDTICTVAIADAMINRKTYKAALLEWCRKYPNPMGGYGGRFAQWIASSDPQPYNSYGNGSAMRVSPVGWGYTDLEKTLFEAEMTALPTHNHPEGIKGAKAVAHAIHVLRNKGSIRDFMCVVNQYYPSVDYSTIKPGKFDETCMGTVPLAFKLFYESSDFEDAIRRAVAWGGDSDTIAAIVGSLAEARWGVPWYIAYEAMEYILPKEMKQVILDFWGL